MGFSQDLMWWITIVDLPALAGLLAMIGKVRGETEKEMDALHYTLDVRCDQLREGLHAFKLEVAKTYASQKDLRALEGRLVDHLLRIEAKLDVTAIKTAELNAFKGRDANI